MKKQNKKFGLVLLLMTLSNCMVAQYIKPNVHYPLDAKLMFPSISYAKFMIVNPYDAGGEGRHATIVGEQSLLEGDAPGGVLTSMKKASGVASYGTIPDPFANHNVANGAAISFWIKPDNSSGEQLIISTSKFQITRSGTSIIVNGTTVADFLWPDTWSFMCFTLSQAGEARIFTTFYPVGSLTNSILPFPFNIGNSSISQIMSTEYGGSIRDVKFYLRPLDPAEVEQVYSHDVEWMEQTDDPHFILNGMKAYYPVNFIGNNPLEDHAGDNDGIQQYALAEANRFGVSNEAVDFNIGKYSRVPESFFGNTYDPREGITVSFWTKILNSVSGPTDGVAPPYTKDDSYFAAVSGLDASGDALFGMYKVVDRLGVYRYTDNGMDKLPYYFWFYDDASFRNQAGWYHIVLTYFPNYMKIYVGKPDGTFICRYNYQGLATQDWSDIVNWYIGSPGIDAMGHFDEIRFYNWPLSELEVNALHNYEMINPSGGGGGANAHQHPEMETKESVIVYPNPAENSFNVQFNLEERSEVSIVMRDLMGKEALTDQSLLSPGRNVKTFDRTNLSSGIYVIEVNTGKWKKAIKLIIE